MRFNILILITILSSVLFSCGSGNKSDNPNDQNADISDSDSQEEDNDCINGTYRCKGNMVQKCDEEKWQNVQKCTDDRVCNEETGKCDLKSNEIDDNDDSDKDNLPDENNDKDSECAEEGDFKCHSPFVSYICQDGFWKLYKECPEEEICHDETGQCSPEIGQTRNVNCINLPENAEWNSVSSITQTWNGEEYIPSNKGSFNEDASTTECRFKCKSDYSWQISNSTCKLDSEILRIQNGKIAEGTYISIPECVITAILYIQNDSNENTAIKGIYVSDILETTKPYTGIYIFIKGTTVPLDEYAIGDKIGVAGTYKEYYENSQIEVAEIKKLGKTNVPKPAEIENPTKIATHFENGFPTSNHGTDAEKYESVLVKVTNIEITNIALNSGDLFEVSGNLAIDKTFYNYPKSDRINGKEFKSITGILIYSDNAFRLAPRSENDFEE